MEPGPGQAKDVQGPVFVIDKDGRLYVTLAVLEYDPNAKDITAEQKKGVADMQKMFKDSQSGGGYQASEITASMRAGPINTGPVFSDG